MHWQLLGISRLEFNVLNSEWGRSSDVLLICIVTCLSVYSRDIVLHSITQHACPHLSCMLTRHTKTNTHKLAHIDAHLLRIIESALFLPPGWPPCVIVQPWNMILFPAVDYYSPAMYQRTRQCSLASFFFCSPCQGGDGLKSKAERLFFQCWNISCDWGRAECAGWERGVSVKDSVHKGCAGQSY